MITTRTMTHAAVAALVLSLWAPAAAQEPDLRETVLTMLGGYEAPAAADADWVALGAGAAPHLLAIAADGAQPTSRRARAIAALGNFPGADVESYLASVLSEPVHNSLQRNALRSLARTAGASRLSLIASFLAHEDSTLREAAVHALGVIGTPEARAAIEARRPVETSSAVTAAMDAELAP